MSPRDAFAPPPDPVVEIATGRIRGFVDEGVHAFLGVPYGAPVGGAGRFRAPRPPEPWAGVRPALAWGPVAPQAPRNPWAMGETAAQEELFLFEYDEGRPGEDCLRLNVWTPEAGSAPRRPVMVWLHGGHFSAGSAQEQKACHGAALARRGDVVVVSLNHRLNVLAFLNLTACGPDWADSPNAGMLDIVLALRWVRDNIAAFGGDPGNVTIFGQSGGGAKVTTLMAMPAAAGLFHRAIVQSNCALRQMDMETSLAVTAGILGKLGLSHADAARLQGVPYDVLGRAEQAVMARLCPPPNPARRNRRIRWEPVVDGRHLPRHAFDPDAPALSADVPLLVGTTLNEFVHGIGRPEVEAMTDAAVRAELEASFGEPGAAIDDLMRIRHPRARPFDRLSRAYGATIRQSAVTQAARKAAAGRAPAYLYWFTWQTPVMGGRPRAFHCAELPFVFHNAARCPRLTGGGPEALDLADRVADAWIAFARHGAPGHAGLPDWPAFDARTVPTMVFDAPCVMLHDPDGAERALTGEA
jgi:para-nitrobenzyl esterase